MTAFGFLDRFCDNKIRGASALSALLGTCAEGWRDAVVGRGPFDAIVAVSGRPKLAAALTAPGGAGDSVQFAGRHRLRRARQAGAPAGAQGCGSSLLPVEPGRRSNAAARVGFLLSLACVDVALVTLGQPGRNSRQ